MSKPNEDFKESAMRILSVFLLVLLCVSFVVLPAYAQEEIDIEYGDIEDFEFSEDDDEVVFIFEGNEGDIISVVAAFEYSEDFDYDSTLEMELEDEDERLIAESQSLDFLFAIPGFVVELESDGEHRLNVQFDGSGEATMVLALQESTFLSEDEFTFEVAQDGLPSVFGISVEDDGLYEISLTPEDDEMPFTFELLGFSGGDASTLASVWGNTLRGRSIIVELEEGETYIGTMGNLFGTLFDSGGRNTVDVSLSMVPFED
jgi:hypothetical protein